MENDTVASSSLMKVQKAINGHLPPQKSSPEYVSPRKSKSDIYSTAQLNQTPEKVIGLKRKRQDPALSTISGDKFLQEAVKVSSSSRPRNRRVRHAELENLSTSIQPAIRRRYKNLEEAREDYIRQRQVQIQKILDSHDNLVRQLFHMEKFVTLIGFDPALAKEDQSEIFLKFREPYDLLASQSGRSGRRLRSNVSAFRESVALHNDIVQAKPKLVQGAQRAKSNQSIQKGNSPHEKRTYQRRGRVPSPSISSSDESEYGDDSSDSDMDDDSIISGSVSPSFIPPKIRLIVRLSKPEYTRPTQIPIPRKFGGLDKYLDSYVVVEDEDIQPDEWPVKIRRQAQLLDRIEEVKRESLGPLSLLSSNKTTASLTKSQFQVQKKKVHWDFLLEQCLLSSRLIREDGKARVNRCRRVAKMISNFWERLKGQDERLRREEQKRIRRLAKWTANEVRKKWKMVEGIVRAKQKAMLQAEQEERGKRHLNLILEHSTQMLEAQRNELNDHDEHSLSESESLQGTNPDRFRSSSIASLRDSAKNLSDAESELGDKMEIDEDQHYSDQQLSELEKGKEENFLPDVDGASDDISDATQITDPSESENDFDEASSESEEDEEESHSLGALLGYNVPKDKSAVQVNGVPGTVRASHVDSLSDRVDTSDNHSETDMDQVDESSDDEELNALKKDVDMPIEEILRDEYGIDGLQKLDNSFEMDTDSVALVKPAVIVSRITPDRELINGDFSSPIVAIETGSNGLKGINAPDNGDVAMKIESLSESESLDSSIGLKALVSEVPSDDDQMYEEVGTQQHPADGDYEPPRGITLATTNVKTQVPFLLRGKLREYQHVGLDWLASLYNNGMNGILADEMGLGKTIQTISLLAYLACEKFIWGPHLIVVPTSVMLNWEMEFKKFLPGFKVLTYYGSQKERKEKRIGWSKENTFHVIITSYQLVIQDQAIFRRKPWQYLILDEAHNIKNFRSQRWQTLLNFNSQRRLLLTGTPLQNNLMELWSLLYFLMPNGVTQGMPLGFANQREFQEWFSHPLDKMVETGDAEMDEETRFTIMKLHTVLRPFLLRRLKIDVEKQMPAKYEHVIYCRLSKRQRFLYDDFMSRSKTKETLASGNFLSIINCLMQLRKVCNHPDLFELRPIVTSMNMSRSVVADFEIKDLLIRRRLLQEGCYDRLNLEFLGLVPLANETLLTKADVEDVLKLDATHLLQGDKILIDQSSVSDQPDFTSLDSYRRYYERLKLGQKADRWKHLQYVNSRKMPRTPVFGAGLIRMIEKSTVVSDPCSILKVASNPRHFWYRTEVLGNMVESIEKRYDEAHDLIDHYAFVTPKVVAPDVTNIALSGMTTEIAQQIRNQFDPHDFYHFTRVKLSIQFPDKRLLQYDCGKLQELDVLLRRLKAEGHRALIFTQMTRVLDILEIFLNMHGYRYMRLDGATKIEQRQIFTERFNSDPRITVFILSTRSGGLGINLTGADTVIFYDSDWNPCMDRQCQDRCHRIGQTRDVHIYRFVSEYTIEENMLRKANQKRMLDNVVITEGDFTTDYFNKVDWRDMLGDAFGTENKIQDLQECGNGGEIENALALAEEEEDAAAAKMAQTEMNLDVVEFTPDVQQQRNEEQAKVVISTAETTAQSTAQTSRTGTEAPDGDMDVDNDDGIGHVDDYMLRFIEREEGLDLS